MHLYALSLQHEDDPEHGHTLAVLRTMSPAEIDVGGALDRLSHRGLARQTGAGLWAPTVVGRREALRIIDGESESGR